MNTYQFGPTNRHRMTRAVMNDKNKFSNLREPNVRITRALAKALGSSGNLPPLYPSAKQNDRALQRNLKRAVTESNKTIASTAACPRHKKRAVLGDITNITHKNVHINGINPSRGQHIKQDRESALQKKGKAAAPRFAKKTQVRGNKRENVKEETGKVKVDESQEIGFTKNLTIEPTESNSNRMLGRAGLIHKKANIIRHISLRTSLTRENGKLCKLEENLEARGIIDIDSKHKDPQMCSHYAADIYSDLYATEHARRPLNDYMEKLQRDISWGMRAILIDWLVEVSDEYKLVPDALYLTVNLIDRFLSKNSIEKQKLQLLGVTCMLIASKYEEICAPRVEEFCFITDNTYTKDEVVKMESRVLNLLGFHLSVPTIKKFLRRFIQAAQVSYEVPSVELEFLANYLAELTLTEHSFIKFLPSLIAASAVFLARWTLDQSNHPWNPTLEYYTRYNASALKCTVLELQELQLNTCGSMLNATREKYKQSKFKSVATLHPSKPVQSLF